MFADFGQCVYCMERAVCGTELSLLQRRVVQFMDYSRTPLAERSRAQTSERLDGRLIEPANQVEAGIGAETGEWILGE